MARYKPVKTDFTEKKRKLAKKNYHKFRFGIYAYGLLMISLIVIGGIFDENDPVIGITCIAIGLLTFGVLAFICYAEKSGWLLYEIFPCDYMEGISNIYTKNERERRLKEHRGILYIVSALLFCTAIYVIIMGFIKIF